MKTFFRLCILVAMLGTTVLSAYAQTGTDAKLKSAMQMLAGGNGTNGKDFWIAIPPNDPNQPGYWVVSVYIACAKDAVAKVENPLTGFSKNVTIQAGKVATVLLVPDDEVRESDKVSNKGFHITANQAIAVYVMNARPTTSDGYLALPTSVLGKEYIHCSYYDWDDNSGQPIFGNGFVVVATEDNTQVRATLAGVGTGRAFDSDKKIGSQINVTLSKGQTYMIRGRGDTGNANDYSGTVVTATKPVGFISFHMRASIPAGTNTGSRDHLCEMIPPTQSWGKKFVSTQLETGSNKGDMYRVMASQNNTQVHVDWYDRKSGQKQGQRDIILQKGKFAEWDNPTTLNHQSINGVAVWTATKPVLLMQYAYSQIWYNNGDFDPDMVIIPPIDQYIGGTIFQTPGDADFATNWFGLYAIGDPKDSTQALLKSLTIDGRPIWKEAPTLLFNRIPTTDIYWVNLKVIVGPHQIKGDTKFGGIIYGFNNFDGYNWPAAMAVNKIDEVDTLPPVLVKKDNCGDWEITATEVRTYGKPGDSLRQIDQGVSEITLLDSISINYDNYVITLPASGQLTNDPKDTKVIFQLKVQDKTKDAIAYFFVKDGAGNFTLDSVRYIADKLTFTPNPLDFQKVRIKTEKQLIVTLSNPSAIPVKINKIKLWKGTDYKIADGSQYTEIPAKGNVQVTVVYMPKKTNYATGPDATVDKDSLQVETGCATFSLFITGTPVAPRIVVDPWPAGTRAVGTTYCNTNEQSLKIENTGNDILTITSVGGVQAPFTLSDPTIPALPISIPAKQSVMLKTLCFAPTEVKKYEIKVKFESDAAEGDGISPWTGEGVAPGLNIAPVDWKTRRVGTINDSITHMYNTGTAPVVVTNTQLLKNNDGLFSFYEINGSKTDPPLPSFSLAEKGKDSILVRVRYTPGASGHTTNNVVGLYKEAGRDKTTADDGEPDGLLEGTGYLPMMATTDTTFPEALVGTKSLRDQYFVITNTGDWPLHIHKVQWQNAGQDEFEWTNPEDPANPRVAIASDRIIPVGESIKIPVSFTARKVGQTFQPVEVVSDSGRATEPFLESIPPISTSIARIYGSGRIEGYPTIVGTTWPATLTCDDPEQYVEISSTADENILLDQPDIIGADRDAFELVQPAGGFPMTLTRAQPVRIYFKFKPSEARTYAAQFQIKAQSSSQDYGIMTANLAGEGYKVTSTFSLNKIESEPGARTEVIVSYDNPKAADASISSVRMTIAFNKQMHYNNGDQVISMVPGWDFTATQNPDATEIVLEGTNRSGEPLNAKGELAKIPVTLLLFAPEGEVVADIDGNVRLSFTPELPADKIETDHPACVLTEGKPGEVLMTQCFINGRGITSKGKFSLVTISPNPSAGNAIGIDYAVAYRAHTRIDVVNSIGEVVSVLADQDLDTGNYRAVLDASVLSSGVYTLRMYSGAFVETQHFVITK